MLCGATGVTAGAVEVDVPSVTEASLGPVGDVSTKDSPITRKRIFSPEKWTKFLGHSFVIWSIDKMITDIKLAPTNGFQGTNNFYLL